MVSNRLLALHVELVRSKLPLTIAGVMQSIGSGAGLGSHSWLAASAGNKAQITGSAFLSNVAALHGIAAHLHGHRSSACSGARSSRCLHRASLVAANSSRSSKSSSRSSGSVVAAGAGSNRLAQQSTTSRALPPSKATKQKHAVTTAAVRRTAADALHPPDHGWWPVHRPTFCQQQQLARVSRSCLGMHRSCNHAFVTMLNRAVQHAALAGNGYNGPQGGNAADEPSAANDAAWRSRRYTEWTSTQKQQVLREKLYDKWQEDPAVFGVDLTHFGQQRLTCPQCQNGSKSEDGFAVSVQEDSVLWKCHRATCDFHGGVTLMGGTNADSAKVMQVAREQYSSVMKAPGTTQEFAARAEDAFRQLQKQTDYKPQPGSLGAKLRPLSEAQELLQWFKQRNVSEETLQRNGVMMEMRFCKALNKTVPHIAFPYYKNGGIVNVKYRALEKHFSQSMGGEQIFYGYDDAKGVDELIIVEGEVDKLSIDEALHDNPLYTDRKVAVVSVPSGAPGTASSSEGHSERKFRFVEACSDVLSSVGCVTLAVDADGPGIVLADELSRRIGREKCKKVNWPTGPRDSYAPGAWEAAEQLDEAERNKQPPPESARAERWARKDANEVLQKEGRDLLRRYLLEAQPLPIQGLFSFWSYWEQVYDLYQQGPKGLSWGVSTGWSSVDACYQVVPGELTIVSGLPNSGKSEWLDALAVNLAKQHGWRFGLCSLENTPVDHARKLMEKYTGKAYVNASYSYGTTRMDFPEMIDALLWLDTHFHMIRPPPDTMPNIDYILDKAMAAVLRYGIQGLIIDPYNELDHSRSGGMSETEHVSRLLTKIKRFAQHYDCHVWFVAHPRTQRGLGVGGGTASLPAPTMYDVSGSANFINKADNGVVVHRPFAGVPGGQGDPFHVQLLVRKVRNKLAGKIGDVTLRYERATGRYEAVDLQQVG